MEKHTNTHHDWSVVGKATLTILTGLSIAVALWALITGGN
jgi:hypothetical protein